MMSIKKVLVVDDDPDILKLLRTVLTVNGFLSLEAADGMTALKILRREKPECVLLDIMLPDIDGYEVYRRIKLNPETKDIPVLFLTAKARSEDIDFGLALGADGYITKPFSPSKLVAQVEKVLGTNSGPVEE